MKKAVVLSFEFPPFIGGAGVYAADLAVGLSKLEYEVTVITYCHGTKSDEYFKFLQEKYGIRVRPVKGWGVLHFIGFALWSLFLIKSSNPDIIVINDTRAKKLVSVLLPLFQRYLANAVTVFHGSEYNSFFEVKSPLVRLFRIEQRFKELLKSVRMVVVPSQSLIQLWSRKSIHIPQDKLVLINHGVNEDIFFRADNELHAQRTRSKYGVGNQQPLIVSASRLVRMKGQDNLLEACGKLRLKIPNLKVLVAGDGAYKPELIQAVARLGLSENILFTGALSRQELSALYSAADLFVLTSRYEESFGLVYIEAAGCGCPSIGSARGGVKDAIIDGVTGFLVHPERNDELVASIEKVLTDKSLRTKLANQSYIRFVEGFTSTVMANKLLDAYAKHV